MSSSPVWIAIKRGMRLRCPSCGTGTLLYRYLKVEASCPACGEDNGRHRVDDAAAYLTILLVGHLLIAPMLAVQYWLDVAPALALGISIPAVTVVTLALLPFVKGGVLGVLSAIDRRAIAEAVMPGRDSRSAPPPAP